MQEKQGEVKQHKHLTPGETTICVASVLAGTMLVIQVSVQLALVLYAMSFH